MNQRKKGITLIALVSTIIILLILVAITIILIIGEDGVILKAKRSEIETRAGTIKDRLQSFRLARLVEQSLNETSTIPEVAEIIDTLKQEGLITPSDTVEGNIIYFEGDSNKEKGLDVEKFIWDDPNLVVPEPDPTPPPPPTPDPTPEPDPIPDISEMKIGDKVIFDSTEGVDPSLLEIQAIVGNAKEGENVSGTGYHRTQNNANIGTIKITSWYVLEKDGQNVTLVSEEPTAIGFTLQGGRGYLFAEQEIHRMCSIYGHHKLANKELNGQYAYQIGNPEIPGELQTKKIADLGLNTGARSLTERDIEKILGNPTIEEKRELYRKSGGDPESVQKYQTRDWPLELSYMPTLKGIDKFGMCAESVRKKRINYTYYSVSKNLFPQIWQDKLFGGEGYWLASRVVTTAPSTSFGKNPAHFEVRQVDLGRSELESETLFYNGSPGTDQFGWIRRLRPVCLITVDSSAIVTKENDAWKIVAK